MSKPAIEVKGISKSYKISKQQAKNAHPTIKEDFVNFATKPLEWVGLGERNKKEDFWALKNISFEVQPGEVLGVVGRNGSGKSTLFKILSRITQPTEGEAILRGKTASLLEVGTGFHPELTGRENVYLNGSILGMKKSEIDRQFDEIVAFSEIEKFIDTPVKFYSSGMKVRLAFSVAAHLKAEILIIDEVLAVGDLRFKQKSIERMRQIAASGKTILFVSHIVRHVQRICSRGIVLQDGEIVLNDNVEKAVELYLELLDLDDSAKNEAANEDGADMSMESDDYKLEIINTNTLLTDSTPQAEIEIAFTNNTDKKLEDIRTIFRVNSQLGGTVITLTNDMVGKRIDVDPGETKKLKLSVNDLPLIPDTYDVHIVIREMDPKGIKYVRKQNAFRLTVPSYDTGYHEKAGTNPLANGVYVPFSIDLD